MKSYKEWLQAKLLKENIDHGYFIVRVTKSGEIERVFGGPFLNRKQAEEHALQHYDDYSPTNDDALSSRDKILYGYLDDDQNFHELTPTDAAKMTPSFDSDSEWDTKRRGQVDWRGGGKFSKDNWKKLTN